MTGKNISNEISGGALRRRVPEFLNVPWSIRDIVVFVVLWFGVQIVGLMLMRALSPVVPSFGHFLDLVVQGDIMAMFALNLVDAAVGFGIISLYLRRYGVGWSTAGWRRVSPLRAAGYILAILVFFVVMANILLWVVSALVPGFDANQAQNNDFVGAAGTHRNLALVALVLMPPVLEETIFRGFVFPAIAKRAGVIWGAVLSSALFGLVHWQANISVYTFILGLLLCFMYVRLRSIVPGIFLHMLNNYLAFIALGSGK
jgi:uncharacterized protein